MTPDEAASVQYDALSAEDDARVDTRTAFISGYRTALTNTGRYESMRHEATALDGLATNGPAQAYTMGYEAGRVEAFAQQAATAVESATSELEALAAGGYTAAQEARADAIAAASPVLAAAVRSNGLVVGPGIDGIQALGVTLVRIAREAATWIEHGDQPKACPPIPCPPFEESSLAVDPATFDRHVDDALGTIKDNPDLGDRVDQALDAAKLAVPHWGLPRQP